MSNAKKSKQPTQTTNLHAFFSNPNASAKATPKVKSASKPKIKPSVVQEIIVIDSDDDAPAQKKVKGKGKSRVAPPERSSSDIEVVEDAVLPSFAPQPALSVSSKRKRSSPEAGGPLQFGQPSTLLVSSSPPPAAEKSNGNNVSMFGAPSGPLCDEAMAEPDLEKRFERAAEPCSETCVANASGPSMEERVERTPGIPTFERLKPDACLSAEKRPTLSTENSHQDVFAEDEWGMGDEEAALLDTAPDEDCEDGNDSDVEIVDVQETAEDGHPMEGDRVMVCPVCNKHLKGCLATEMQDHVNDCIDSSAPTTSASDIPSTSGTPLKPSNAHSSPSPKPLRPLSSLPGLGGTSAFSVLMASHKENAAWKEASAAEDRSFKPTKANGGRRKAPFYKVMQGMPIAVDAFRYGTIPGVTAYFLTHAHSDHYTNLASNWKSGPIYCSEGTANLIIHMLDVDKVWVHPLPMDVPTVVPNTGGVRVTLIEANHCPGSCLFVFDGPQTINAGDSTFKSPYVGSSRPFRYLHCGDFRASPAHALHPAVNGKRIDHVYLDTTYLDPKYTFPPQPLVISACAELARRLVTGEAAHEERGALDAPTAVKGKPGWFKRPEKGKLAEGPKGAGGGKGDMLIVVGTYSIGKERIVKAIARALDSKVYCDARKAAILRCQADSELDSLLTRDPFAARVHVVPLGVITSDRLKEYVDRWKGRWSKAVGFRPTGWTFTQTAGANPAPPVATTLHRARDRPFTYTSLRPARNSTPQLQLYGVPYSEHSSFFELTAFALSVDWGRMIATVNVGSVNSRAKMAKWFERWEGERKRRKERGEGMVEYRAADYW